MIKKIQSQDEGQKLVRLEGLVETIRQRNCISLFIETASLCNLKCKFCGFQQENHTKKKGIMSADVENRIYTVLANTRARFMNINFYNHGESLCNARTPDIVRRVRGVVEAKRYRLVTNGALLRADVLADLIDAGINDIKVSLDVGERERYKYFKRVDCFEKVKENIDAAARYILDKGLDVSLTIKACNPRPGSELVAQDLDDVLALYRGLCEGSDNIHVEIVDEYEWKSGGDIDAPCEAPFTQCVINFDGVISPCCVDTDYKIQIGNIFECDSLDDVLFGKKMRGLRRAMLVPGAAMPVHCRECGVRTCVDVSSRQAELLDLI